MKKRVVSLILALSLIGGLCVPAFAVETIGGIGYETNLDTASAQQWKSFIGGSVNGAVLTSFATVLDAVGNVMTGYDVDRYAYFNWLISTGGYGEISEDKLHTVCRNMNSRFNSSLMDILVASAKKTDAWRTFLASFAGFTGYSLFQVIGLSDKPNFRLAYDSNLGVYRIKEMVTGYWLVDTKGRFVCYRPESASFDPETSAYADQWIQSSTLDTQLADGSAQLHMTSKAALEALASQLGSGVREQHWHEYYVIANMAAGNSRSVPIRCDYAGFPYACWYDENTAAVNTPRTTTDIDNVDNAAPLDQTNDSTEINYNGMTIVLPDGDFNIGEINYNSNNKTYNIEAYKYDITNNYYYTYNYSWTYHINYTSITYIGQSEEYDRTYNLYYQLPDGRSSADLTAEELEQLNLAVDVINYGRSADDTRLRSLYHFDGNTDDASYWNYCTAFTWNQGASLTYLESGNFNGALYLDETDHDFTLTLPSAIGSNDFTLQFRYYQSATAAPQDDSYIRFGSTDLMRFNGSQILNGSGTVLSTMPIGTWNELAIIRESGTVRYYLNGVQLGTISNTTAFTAAVTFHFGTSQQTYKELDELRVLNYALTSGGASYTPTSVPHDTNLALVLPDSVVPVADEYWDIHNDTQTNLLSQYNLDWWDSNHSNSGMLSSNYYSVPSSSSYNIRGNHGYISFSGDGTYYDNYWTSYYGGIGVVGANKYSNYNPSLGQYTLFPSYTGVVRTISSFRNTQPSVYPTEFFVNAGVLPIIFKASVAGNYSGNFLISENYFLTLVMGDGSTISCPVSFSFRTPTDSEMRNTYETRVFENSDLVVGSIYMVARYGYCLGFALYPKHDVEVVYMELVEGDHSDLTAEFVSSVTLMDSASLNTPTLAVRSDIPVTNYQIGGVRPSIPYKGLVWAMVESGYISSLQIYDGRAWVQCDGRIWTGERWIPYSSYNVVTLSDMYDIADASGQSGYEYIYSESGFWSWFQKAWLDFRQWTSTMLSTVQGLGSGGGSSGGSVVNDLDVDPDSEEESSVWLVGFIKRIAKLGGRAVRGVSDIVIEDALSNAADGLGNMQSFYSADASEPDGYVTTFSLDGSDGNLHGFAVYDASEVWQ